MGRPMLATILLAVATGACGGSTRADPDANLIPPNESAVATNWPTVAAHYDILQAVAGAGATDTGTNEWLPAFEGQPATGAELSRPHMAMADAAGNVYIADKEAHAIRRVTPAGTITTYAGTGVAGVVDDTPGPATQRALANPNGLFVRPDGTLYILDLDHGRIRKVTTAGTMSTLVTVAGGIGIGRGLWVDGADGSETVFFSSGNAVKRWTAASGVTTWASGFVSLGNIAMDGARLLVSDRGGNRVYAVTDVNGTGMKVPVAGNGSAGAGVDGAAALSTPLEGVRAVWPALTGDGGGFFAGLHEGYQVWFIDAAGLAHLFLDGGKDVHAGIGGPYNAPGEKVSEMRSVTLTATGDVLIVDDDRGFVTRVKRK